jgi:ribosomal protein S27E
MPNLRKNIHKNTPQTKILHQRMQQRSRTNPNKKQSIPTLPPTQRQNQQNKNRHKNHRTQNEPRPRKRSRNNTKRNTPNGTKTFNPLDYLMNIDTMSEYNHKHVQTTCPECKHTEILVDPFHGETYCAHCGLVLKDNRIPSILTEIKRVEYEVMFIRSLWHKKKGKKSGKKSFLKPQKVIFNLHQKYSSRIS